MQRVKPGPWWGVSLCLTLGAPPVSAGTGGDAGVELQCLNTTKVRLAATECLVPVTANRVAGSDCQISVAQRVRFKLPVQQLHWALGAAPGTRLLYRFRPGDGVVVDGNSGPAGGPLYERDGLGSSDIREVHRVRDRNLRESTYTIRLQWRASKAARWTDCDPLDPFISNDG